MCSQHFRHYQGQHACDQLGAIAFEMMAKKSGPEFAIAQDYASFRTRVLKRFLDAGANRDEFGEQATRSLPGADWDALLAMDPHGLRHFIFSTDASDQQLRWTDITTMAFFAAYWACRWATKADRGMMRNWVIDPLEDANAAYREFWTFAAELPDEAVDRERWVALFELFYDGSVVDAKGHPIRSTEFIYRSWERMAGTAAQSAFLSQFKDIRQGKEGSEKKVIADDLLVGFIQLVGNGEPSERNTFPMGAPPDEDEQWDTEYKGGKQDNPRHDVTLSPYCLHQFCVTNVQYELFDRRHKDYRWVGRHPSVAESEGPQASKADDRCPVVKVSWYDAWCFAKWLGVKEIEATSWRGKNKKKRRCRIELPTEAQWEYACRAGWTTPLTFHQGHDGKTCTADVCNFNGEYPFGRDARKEPSRGFTLPVDGREWDGKKREWSKDFLKPNLWGFFQMHGNVWDWYAAGFYETEKGKRGNPLNDQPASARVLRGGGWFSFGRGCRSAVRLRDEPGDRDLDCGFRLAAVPVVGAK